MAATAAIQYRRVEIIKKEGKKKERGREREREKLRSIQKTIYMLQKIFTFLSCHLVAQQEDEKEIRKENCSSLIEFQQ